ncbi:MAG: hypothetical protein IJ506_06770 [Clostridia bacterium]|nr:hypothetical protein [Clostridia bacterium]
MAKKKLILFICNIVITILCVFSIATYFIAPLWTIDLSYTVSAEMLEEMIGQEDSQGNGEGENGGDGSGEGTNNNTENVEKDVWDEIDVKEIVGEDGVTVKLTIRLQTSVVLSSLDSDATKVVEGVIDTNVDKVVEQLSGTLNKVAKGLVSQVSKVTLKTTVKEQVKKVFENNANFQDADRVEQILDEIGITDEYIEEKTQGLMDVLYAENATTEKIADKVTDTVAEVFDKLGAAGDQYEEFVDAELSEEDKAEIHDQVAEVLSKLEKEDGTINVDDFVSEIMLALLNGEDIESVLGDKLGEDSSDESGSGAEPSNKAMNATYLADSTAEEEKETTEELKEKVRQTLLDSIPKDAAETVALVMQIVSYVLFFTFFTWAYLIIKILIKTFFAANNGIKLKLPIILGWLPFLVLVLLPSLAISLLSDPTSFLGEMVGAETAKTMSAMTISFSSGAWVSFAVAIFLIVFFFAYYGRVRKKLKKELKAKKEGK